jgi:hypothetical protein
MLLLAGCSEGDPAGPEAAVGRFEAALAAGAGEQGCAVLSEAAARKVAEAHGGSCSEALVAQDLPHDLAVLGVDVFGRQARVVLGADTLFLAEFPNGWRVTAAGCTAQDDAPYDCAVEGG